MSGFVIEATALPVLSYAMVHNGIGLVGEVTLTGPEDIDGASLSIQIRDDEGVLSKPFTVSLDLMAGNPSTISGPAVELDGALISQVAEQRPGEVVLELRDGATLLAQRSYPVTVLAARQWLGLPRGLAHELLASHVMPNAPEIGALLQAVGARLGNTTGSSAIEGYQSGSARVDQIVQAIYEQLQGRGIGYSEPPASWADVGQKIRTPQEVIEGRLGTCLDTCVVMAAALEQAGVRPLIWVLEGHSVLGFWRAEIPTDMVANTEASSFRNLIDLDAIGMVETTGLTNSMSFERARQAGIDAIRSGRTDCVVDVWAARRARILPLPAVRRATDGSVEIVEYRPAEHSVPPSERASEQVAAAADQGPPVPPRIRAWQNNLLDLSLRNRLINFTPRAGLQLFLPRDCLTKIEDDLHDRRQITLLPNDAFDVIQTARSTQPVSAADLPADLRSKLYAERRSAHIDLTSDQYDSGLQRLAYKARTITEESGANNLYLALGSLVWQLDGRQLRSPVILVPVQLKTRGKAGAYRLVIDDSDGSSPNYCLLEKLRSTFALQVPGLAEPASDGSGIDLDAALGALRLAINQAGLPFHVEDTAHLAILMFGRFRLWKDLDQHWPKLMAQPLVRHLAMTPTQRFAEPAAGQPQIHLDLLAASCPIPSDGSQLAAIAAALSGRSLVVEGPPGTGKSQTIANLLARCIADGRRVLFVAEKRAALSVVQARIKAMGLENYALDLHDKGSRPTGVRAQIQASLEQQPIGDVAGLATSREVVDTSAGALTRYRDRLHAGNAANLSLYRAATERLRLGARGAQLSVPAGFVAGAKPELMAELEAAMRRLPESADMAYPSPDAPWLLVGSDDPDSVDAEAVRRASVRVDEAWDALGADPAVARCLRQAPSPMAIDAVAALLNGPYVVREALTWASEPAWQHDLRRLLAAISNARATAARLHARPGVVGLPMPQLRQDAQTAATSGWFGRKSRLTRVANALSPALEEPAPIDRQKLPALADALLGLATEVDAIKALLGRLQLIWVPTDWNPLVAGSEQPVIAQAERCKLLHRELVASPFARLVTEIWDAQTSPPVQAAAGELATALRELFGLTNTDEPQLVKWTGGQGVIDKWLASRDSRDLQTAGLPALQRWLRFRAALRPLRVAGLADAHWQLLTGQVAADEAGLAWQRGLADASLAERREATGLADFDAATHERIVTRYLAGAAQVRELLTGTLAMESQQHRRFSSASSVGQVGELRRVLSRQRGGLSVREMMARYGGLITQLMPCVLVSPDSLARFIAVDALQFDLVVFDEASQIKVADAVGAIGRARSAVVVGDSKQMPPTTFMEASVAIDLDLEFEDEGFAVADEESILGECVQAGIDRHWLSWHYRSQDESLIAFSNEQYYGGRLSSFPTPSHGEPDPGPDGHGIHLIRVDGEFDRSTKGAARRTNQIEARAVVDEIQRRFRAAPPGQIPSIGVVTFNQPQRTLVERLIRESEDERLTLALEQPGGDGLFVKNLENVQGDERDVILFSVAFGRNARGVLPLNFGPLNLSGGERRLNVAITRARRQVILFASFDPAELRAHETGSIGVKHLKAYLELAAGSAERLAASPNRRSTLDLHRDEIAERLRGRGLEVRTDVGLSDFRVDLVAGLPGQPPVMAILLDGPGWARRQTVGDRDGTPPLVLGSMMGWPEVKRIWLPAWLTDPDAVLDEIGQRVRLARPARIRQTVVPLVEDADDTDRDAGVPRSAAASDRVPAMIWQTGSEDRLARGERTPKLVASASPTPIGVVTAAQTLTDHHPAFRSWDSAVVGSVDTLDQVRTDRRAAAQVRERIAKIIETEGPVKDSRLARLVANSFGLSRVHAERAKSILAQVPGKADAEGFFWPAGQDHASWFRMRPDPQRQRRIEEIHPIEIANAMAELCRASGGLDPDDLLSQAAKVFGFQRPGASTIERLRNGLATAQQTGRIRREGDYFHPGHQPSLR